MDETIRKGSHPTIHNELDLRIRVGRYLLNVLYVNYEPPRPGWEYKNHAHSSYELHFVPTGYGDLHLNGQFRRIEPNTFYLTGPGLIHRQKADEAEPMAEYCMNFEWKRYRSGGGKHAVDLHEEVEEVMNCLTQTNFWFGADEGEAWRFLEAAISEMESHRLGRYTSVQHLAILALIGAARAIAGGDTSDSILPKKVVNDRRRLLVDKFFGEHLRFPCNRKMLAKLIGVSVRQVNRIVKNYYGLSFQEKLAFHRMEVAKELLATTDLPICEIAERVGYESTESFSRQFRLKLGLTPGGYREHHSMFRLPNQ